MEIDEKKYLPYRVDRFRENITGFPDERRDQYPAGNLGWITWRYRQKGWNIRELRSQISEALGPFYGKLGYDGMLDIFTALLSNDRAIEEVGLANDNRPDLNRDMDRLWGSLAEPHNREGWCMEWQPPKLGPVKATPFSGIVSKHPRIHTRVYFDNLVALCRTGHLSPHAH